MWSNIVTGGYSGNVSLDFRMGRMWFLHNGGAPNISNAYGKSPVGAGLHVPPSRSMAVGINFPRGGNGNGYNPIPSGCKA